MTKEQILNKRDLIYYMGSGEDEVEGSKKDVFDSMDEWARVQSIEFEKWKEENNYQKHPNGFYWNEPPIAGKKTWFTLQELYNTFINQKYKL